LFQLTQPLDEADLKTYWTALSKLQGNILTSHGRDFAQHIFLTFNGQPEQAKHFLGKFADRVVSAAAQQAQTDRFKNAQTSELFASVALSAKGYEYLGYAVTGFSKEFQAGMKNAALADPPSTQWEDKFQKPIHAMVILAHDSREELNREMKSLSEWVRGFAKVSSELGIAIHHGNPNAVFEHFGYRDGVSQPIFYKKAVPAEHEQWDPSAGTDLVLVKDPLGGSNDACGTYYVFRKLEQNVRKFQECAANLAKSLKLSGEQTALAGAMIVGRFPDGTPVMEYGEPKYPAENDFTYDLDPDGNKCPFFAHTRKANPRNGDSDRQHRIARRGITYGDPVDRSSDPATWPATGVGLLFQCCQADLNEQFEFLQHAWADNDDSPSKGTGIDPVIGESADGFPALEFPSPWNTQGRTPFKVHSLVTMKGGEYFFVPSISFLKGLNSPAPPADT
jgi:Dyp-type peroxidase family